MNKLLLLLLSCSISSFAQGSYNTTDRTVSLADLHLNTFENDTTANAFFIYEKGFSKFQESGDYNLITEYSAKIKILKSEGYKHASIVIPLQKNKNSRQKLHKIEGATYYLENGIKQGSKLEASHIYTEENEEYDLVKFTFPSLTPGAVVVFSYEKESPFIFNFHPWFFQDEIPKLISSYETEIPGNFNYNIKKVGELELDVNDSNLKKRCFQPRGFANPGDCITAKYVMTNIPAFIEESYLTSRLNYISRIDYELVEMVSLDGRRQKYTRSWKDVDREIQLDQNLGKQLKRNSLVKGLLPDSIQQKPNDLQKAREIYDFVKKNYKWNEEFRIFAKMNLKDILQNKTGNVSSINILMHNIYEEQGYQVLPVMSSTRANGLPTKLYPILSDFNYLLVQLQVGEEKFLLDATEKNADFGDIPYRCLNQFARLMDFKNESSWIDLEPNKFSSVALQDFIAVNPDGTASGSSQHNFTGYHALNSRNVLEKVSGDEILEALANPSPFAKPKDITLKNQHNPSEALQVSYTLENSSQKINDVIYLNPFSFRFFEKNPFQLNSRTYPIDFGYKDSYSYIVNIKLPENYKVEELPEQKLLRLPESGGSLQFFTQQIDEQNLMVNYRISFPKAVYSSSFYPYLKEFFSALIEVQNQSLIVLRENL